MGQVRHHQQSTERQYALSDKALQLGWSANMIRILDRDLGVSGTQMADREDFQVIVADVSMRKVGAVISLEASRLSRSNTDWYRLLELCAYTDTLIIDEDGIYNPADFNDQLLLGLKGTMSQAELHFIHARLQGGRLNKAQKGELRSPLPVGFVYDDDGRTVFDPDREVRDSVLLLFDSFRQTGSAYGVVHRFSKQGLKFPKRAYGGVWSGKLIWGRLTDNRVLAILKNPCYAGAYVYGRYQSVKEIRPDGSFRSRTTKVPMSSWTVLIKDHHEAYIGWDEYIHHQGILKKNRTNAEHTLLGGPAREGLALFQGLIICGNCGRRLTVRYKGNGGIYPNYECNWRRREGLSTSSCMNIRCDLIDEPVTMRALEVIQPKQIEIAIKAFEKFEQRENALGNQWRMRIERAEYEASLAQRRYEEVDPSNRLVASTLERRWDNALVKVEEIKKQYSQQQRKARITATEEQKKQLMSLATDLPRLWKASTTNAKDRKRILRLLIKDITVEKFTTSKQLVLHLRWQGGACEDIPVDIPPMYYEQIRYGNKIIEKVRALAKDHSNNQIASAFNHEKVKSATGRPFTAGMIGWIKYKHRIAGPTLKGPEELTVKQVAKKFDVSTNVVYYWIKCKLIDARKLNKGSPYWVTIDSRKEQALFDRIGNTTKINRQSAEHS